MGRTLICVTTLCERLGTAINYWEGESEGKRGKRERERGGGGRSERGERGRGKKRGRLE